MSRPSPAAKNAPSPPDPKVLEMMDPGPEHQQLAKLAGTWDVSCIFWMKPDEPATETMGVEVMRSIFDGRYLVGEFSASIHGKPFMGHSILGYNRVTKQHLSTWYDNMGTGITVLSGPSEDGGKTVTYAGDMVCPQYGQVSLRQIETFRSDDLFTRVMYQIKDGNERKSMELTYTRRK